MGRILMTGGGGGADLDVITAEADDILSGKVIVDKDGNPLTGTLTLSGDAGAGDEFHQYFVPGRAAQLSDVAIDAMGFLPCVAAVYLVLWAVRRLRN